MASDLKERLEAARSELARLEREVSQATCGEVGHRWEFTGGRHCGCDIGACSLPVHTCRVCGDCDYGENAEAQDIRAKCTLEADADD